jgi:DNA-binding XRE family transcriptional regulator
MTKTVNSFSFLILKNYLLIVFSTWNYNDIEVRGITVKSKEEIAKVLKGFRQKTGLSAKEVTYQLSLHDIEVSPKTLYGWESGHSQPNADTFLMLCDIYGIDDIMRAFGYSKNQQE